MRTRVIAAIAALALGLAGVVAFAAPAQATEAESGYFAEGLLDENMDTSCGIWPSTPMTEYAVGATIGAWVDPNAQQPTPGYGSWIRITVTGIGLPCSGYVFQPSFSLPAGAQVDTSRQVACYWDGVLRTSSASSRGWCPAGGAVTAGAGAGGVGQYSLISDDPQYSPGFQLASGRVAEFFVPVVASQQMSNQRVDGYVYTVGAGLSKNMLTPYGLMTVFPGAGQPLAANTIIPFNPSTIGFPACTEEIYDTVTIDCPPGKATKYGFLSRVGIGLKDASTVYIQRTTTSGNYTGAQSTPVPGLPAGWTGYIWTVWEEADFSAMQPGATYYWRAVIDPDGAGANVVSEQFTFTMPTSTVCNGKTVTVNLANKQQPTSGADVILGTPGDDTITAGGGNDTICAGGGNDRITGGDGNDWIDAGDGNDTVDGGAGNDTVNGGGGNDTIDAGAGNDGVNAGAGDDVVAGSAGTDVFIGGAGADTVSYAAATTAVRASLATTSAQAIATGLSHALSEFENLAGGTGADALTGSAGPNRITGGAGDDTIADGDGNDSVYGEAGNDTLIDGPGNDIHVGGDGIDLLSFEKSAKAVRISLASTSKQTIASGVTEQVQTVENLTGSPAADTITGSAGANTLRGGKGNDRISDGKGNDKVYGDAGNDTFVDGPGNDAHVGGAGTDTLSFEKTKSPVALKLATKSAQRISSGVKETVSGIENVTGGSGKDRLTGTTGKNTLKGGKGNDTLDGGKGNDKLDGGAGKDTCIGGAGKDTAKYCETKKTVP